MTVSASTKEDIGELVALWHTCFGDDEEYISAFMGERTAEFARCSICLTAR